MCKATLRQIRLNAGGYDDSGAYWGVEQRLYWLAFIDGDSETSEILRAPNRYEAKLRARAMFPRVDLRFY